MQKHVASQCISYTCDFHRIPTTHITTTSLPFMENEPLHELLYNSLISLPMEFQSKCSKFVVSGGCSHIPNFQERLWNSLSSLIPHHFPFTLEFLEKNASWKGASFLGSKMSENNEYWILKE